MFLKPSIRRVGKAQRAHRKLGGHAALCPPYSTLGFTLLELLIALFIFTIVSVIMVSALRTVMNSQTSTEKHAQRFSELQLALTLLSRDFEQTIDRPITTMNGALESAFIGGSKETTFSHAGLDNPLGQLQRSTLQRTRYRLEKEVLIRESWPALDQTQQTLPSQRSLLSAVTELSFEYLDKHNQLQNRWPPADQPNNAELPRAVRISLVLRDLGKITQLYIIPGQKSEATK